MALNEKIENSIGEKWQKGTKITLRVSNDPKSKTFGFAPAFFKKDKYLADASSIRVFRILNLGKFKLSDNEDYEIVTGRVNPVPTKKTKRDQTYIFVHGEIIKRIEKACWKLNLDAQLAVEHIASGEAPYEIGRKIPLTCETKIFRSPNEEKLVHMVVVRFRLDGKPTTIFKIFGVESVDHHATQMITTFRSLSSSSIMNKIKNFPIMPDDDKLIKEASMYTNNSIGEPQKVIYY